MFGPEDCPKKVEISTNYELNNANFFERPKSDVLLPRAIDFSCIRCLRLGRPKSNLNSRLRLLREGFEMGAVLFINDFLGR